MKVYHNVLENFILPVADLFLGTRYRAALKQWRSIQHLSEEALNELQEARLKTTLKHAIQHIPFYQKQSSHLTTDGLPDIRKFPIMRKQNIRDNLDGLLWHPEKKKELICEKSSGSSGIQGAVFMSKKEVSEIQAAQTLLWEWAGYEIGKPMLQTGITPDRGFIKSFKDRLFRTHYRSAFRLSEEDVKETLQSLQHRSIKILGGYASSLYVYAQVAQKYNIDIKFESVISWGDKMFAHYQTLIEKQFATKVFDTYGTTEGFMIGAQCDHPEYYILSPFVFFELVDEHGYPVKDGEIGYVVVTSLNAFEMPLIRYYLGDLAVKMPKHEYPSNRRFQFPLLKKIVGRDTDIVKTPSGKKMIVHFFTAIFEHLPEIRQFQVIQENLESMDILYIKGIGFTPDVLTTIKCKIESFLGEPYPVNFREVESISDSPSGKPQIIISKIK
jgi:phenylacetate-CoA ligase